jgi:hypothetical protein
MFLRFYIVSAFALGLMAAPETQAQTMKQKAVIKEIAEAVKPKMDEYKAKCGCEPKVTYDWKEVANENDWRLVPQVYSAISEAASLCEDVEAKKTVCAGFKSVVIKKGEPKSIEFKNGTATFQWQAGMGYGKSLKEILQENL